MCYGLTLIEEAQRKRNIDVVVFDSLLLAGCFFLIRTRATIGNRQLLTSMIPHHAGAVPMCSKASLTDPEIKDSCRGIVEGQ